MPLFITFCLVLSYLAHIKSPYQDIFTSEITLYLGIGCIAISLSGALIKILNSNIWYDLFATGTLLTWFAYWHPFFLYETPMFFLFPLYFAFLTALVHILFISKRDRFDQESIDHMQYFSRMGRFHPGLIVAAILISLLLTNHYLLYPVLMSTFIVRYTMTSCLKGYG